MDGDRPFGWMSSALGCATALSVWIAPPPAIAGVFFDLNYQGRDEIDFSELPADGRITLDLDIGFDGLTRGGEEWGVLGMGVSARFDYENSSFVGGTRNVDSVFNPVPGFGGLPLVGQPRVLREGNDSATLFTYNDVQLAISASLSPAIGTETSFGAYSLTFDVTAPVTFDLLFAQGDGAIFGTTRGPRALLFQCGDGRSLPGLDQQGCEEEDIVRFDGFRITQNGVAVDSPLPIFELAGGPVDPDPMDPMEPVDPGPIDPGPIDPGPIDMTPPIVVPGGGGPTSAVPEPTSALLFGAGLAVVSMRLRRQRGE